MHLIKLILLLLVTRATLLCASQAPYLYVNLLPYPVGMFSVFSYVAGVLYEYDTHNYAGIEVNFEKFGLYYDPVYGPNWWEYYCEPIRLGDKKYGPAKKFDVDEFVEYAYFTQRELDRYQVHSLIQKYIKIREHVQRKIDQFVLENFTGYYVIGVHYRGTDKKVEAPRVPYDKVSASIKKYINENNIQNYKIFVATDEAPFVDFMRKSFPGFVIAYNAQRSNDDKALHIKLSNNYLHGEEALIDCVLLSRGDFLIRTSSNLSLWSTYFNPSIPVIELSQRHRVNSR